MSDSDGPSLEQYIETRFNLLNVALVAAVEAAQATARALKASADATALATDLRYQQRFEAQCDALAAAFLSQQTAMQTAFVVAEKAVQAALAAADRAVSKAELASDKRFEALNELRQMLTDMVANLVPRNEAAQRFDAVSEKVESNAKRIDAIDQRLSGAAGEVAGARHTTDDNKALWATVIAIAAVLIDVAAMVWKSAGG